MKYSLTNNTKTLSSGTILRQIKAGRDILRFGVKAGDLGGWIESKKNLSQAGNAQVSGNAWVYGDARVSQGHYTTRVLSISTFPYQITAIYPHHVQIGCQLFEICDKETAIKTMTANHIDSMYHKQIWLAVQLCEQWIKDNPEQKDGEK